MKETQLERLSNDYSGFEVRSNHLLNGHTNKDGKESIVRSGNILYVSEKNYEKLKECTTPELLTEFLDTLGLIDVGESDFPKIDSIGSVMSATKGFDSFIKDSYGEDYGSQFENLNK